MATGTPALAEASRDDRAQKGQSYWQLVWWRFRRSKQGIVGAVILILLYLLCGVLARVSPYLLERTSGYLSAPPQVPRFVDAAGRFHLRPFVYGYAEQVDRKAFRRYFVIDPSKVYPIYLFARGDPYKLFGLFRTNIHLFGVGIDDPQPLALSLAATGWGATLFSRTIYGGRVSLLVGLVGEIIGLIVGIVLGTVWATMGALWTRSCSECSS